MVSSPHPVVGPTVSAPTPVPQPPQSPTSPGQTQQVSGEPSPTQGKAKSAEEHLVMGSEYDKTVADLMAMGFTKEQATRALKAAFNNPERAAEYLVNVLSR